MAEHEGSHSGDNRGGNRGGNHGGNRGGERRQGGNGRGGNRDGGRGGRGKGGYGRDDRRGGQGGRGRGGRNGGFRGRDGRDSERRQWRDNGEGRDFGERNERRDGERREGDRENRGNFRPRNGGGRGRDDRRGGFNRDERRGGNRRRSNRGGRNQDEKRTHRTGPQRPGFREERIEARKNEPKLPDDVRADELDPSIRQDLKSLAKDNADMVARHMIMAATLLAEDPQRALAHARAAKDRAGRVGVVRETAGVAAYHAGEWKEALSELRAARRISGGPGMLAVMADCERGLGRPEKAIELAHSPEAAQIDAETKTELAIVVAGARRDLGQLDEAIVELEAENLDPAREDFEAARLFYAYADALAAAGRVEDAKLWFGRSANIDVDEFLDSRERIEALENGESGDEAGAEQSEASAADEAGAADEANE